MIERVALGIYLNDHLAGSVAGLEAMERLRDAHQDTPLGRALDVLRRGAQHDQDVLRELLLSIDVAERSTHKTLAWIGEKVSRMKLSVDSEDAGDVSFFEAIETLTLAFRGRIALWTMLATIGPELRSRFDFSGLARQVEAHLAVLEAYRLAAGRDALTTRTAPVTA